MSSTTAIPTLPELWESIKRAKTIVSDHLYHTSMVTSSTLNQDSGYQMFLKCENFQKTGSFKPRGALYAMMKLKENNPDCVGVVTHSSGNFGQGIAWAARKTGLPCTVVIPNNTPAVKSNAIQGYGAELILCEPSVQAREETSRQVSEATGRVILPPSDHVDVIAGHATLGLECLEDVEDLDAILVPICGGELVTGVAAGVKSVNPRCKVFAVEPYGKELEPSLRAGERLWTNPPQYVDTISEGLRRQQVGPVTFQLMCQLIEPKVCTVTDSETADAMKYIWQRTKLVVEPSGSVGVAAVLSGKLQKMDPTLKKVCAILSGGNVDLKLPWS